jgi:hypothetical protein
MRDGEQRPACAERAAENETGPDRVGGAIVDTAPVKTHFANLSKTGASRCEDPTVAAEAESA